MNENRHEDSDEKAAAAGADEMKQEPTPNDDRGLDDPDLAVRAARAEPSRDAERLQYDPAAEDG